jgi:8-oxo-dGTP pyrophosphatase MutT (NUDIX family)
MRKGEYNQILREKLGSMPLIIPGSSILVFDGDSILMQKRADTEKWGIPGGSMDYGESFRLVARRELEEETSLVCNEEDLELVDVFSGDDAYHKYPSGDEVYSAAAIFKIDLEKCEGDIGVKEKETLELNFFKVEDLINLDERSKKIIERVLKKYD